MTATIRYINELVASEQEWAVLAAADHRHGVQSEQLHNLRQGLAVDRVRLVSDLLQIADSNDPAAATALDVVRRLAVLDSFRRRR